MGTNTVKYKRQVRDFYNKNVHDESTITKVAEVIGFPPPDKIAICVWPDDTWCLKDDVGMYSWKSDDYAILHVPIELELNEVEDLVYRFNTNQKVVF
jgi:hypothetical protein